MSLSYWPCLHIELHNMNTQLRTWTCKLRNSEKFSAEVGSLTTSVSTGKPNMAACKCIFSIQQLGMYSTSTNIFSLCHCRLQGPIIRTSTRCIQKRDGHTAHTLNLCYEVFLVSLHAWLTILLLNGVQNHLSWHYLEVIIRFLAVSVCMN